MYLTFPKSCYCNLYETLAYKKSSLYNHVFFPKSQCQNNKNSKFIKTRFIVNVLMFALAVFCFKHKESIKT